MRDFSRVCTKGVFESWFSQGNTRLSRSRFVHIAAAEVTSYEYELVSQRHERWEEEDVSGRTYAARTEGRSSDVEVARQQL